MKAMTIQGERLSWQEVDDPKAGVGEALIAVHATAVNRADLLQRAGGYPPPSGASDILGLECAGEVVATGEGVTSVRPGDEVCALLAGGGYAERVAVPAGQVLPVPSGLDMVQAAALPEVFATAYLNLYMEANLERGERVLIHAGASGVGTAAIQLCGTTGNPCFVTVGNPQKIERCVALGADGGWDRHQGSFLDAVQEWGGVDVVLDPVGAGYLADNLSCLHVDGRLSLIGLMGGVQSEISLATVVMKRLRIIGSTLRARSVAAKSLVMDALQRDVWPHLEGGSIVPIIDEVLPIEAAERAHELMAGDQTFGKLVLQIVE